MEDLRGLPTRPLGLSWFCNSPKARSVPQNGRDISHPCRRQSFRSKTMDMAIDCACTRIHAFHSVAETSPQTHALFGKYPSDLKLLPVGPDRGNVQHWRKPCTRRKQLIAKRYGCAGRSHGATPTKHATLVGQSLGRVVNGRTFTLTQSIKRDRKAVGPQPKLGLAFTTYIYISLSLLPLKTRHTQIRDYPCVQKPSVNQIKSK